jgi:hypothetical protein
VALEMETEMALAAVPAVAAVAALVLQVGLEQQDKVIQAVLVRQTWVGLQQAAAVAVLEGQGPLALRLLAEQAVLV